MGEKGEQGDSGEDEGGGFGNSREIDREFGTIGRVEVLMGVKSFCRRETRFIAQQEPTEIARRVIKPSLNVGDHIGRTSPSVKT